MLFLNIREKIIGSDFLKNAAKLAGGTALAQIIVVLASPLLSRLYSPAEFGTFALYNSFVSVLLIICTGRYEIGIVSTKSRNDAVGLLTLSFLILATVLVISSTVFFLFRDWINTIFINDPSFNIILFFIPLTVLFLGAYQIFSYWLNKEKKYNTIAISKVVQNLSNTGVTIILGFLFSLGIGLILGHLFGAIVAVIFLLIRKSFPLRETRDAINKKELIEYAKKYSDFPKYSLPTAFLDTFSLQIPVFMIVLYFNETVAGHFSFAYRILSLPISFIGLSLGQVFYQKLTELYINKQECKNFILRMWGSLFMMGILPFVILLTFGEGIFKLIFGDAWSQAGEIASILSIPLLFMFCSSPTSTAFIVFGIQKYSFFIGVISIILRPLAFYLGYLYNDIYLGLILWGIFEITLIIVYNTILLKKIKE